MAGASLGAYRQSNGAPKCTGVRLLVLDRVWCALFFGSFGGNALSAGRLIVVHPVDCGASGEPFGAWLLADRAPYSACFGGGALDALDNSADEWCGSLWCGPGNVHWLFWVGWRFCHGIWAIQRSGVLVYIKMFRKEYKHIAICARSVTCWRGWISFR